MTQQGLSRGSCSQGVGFSVGGGKKERVGREGEGRKREGGEKEGERKEKEEKNRLISESVGLIRKATLK